MVYYTPDQYNQMRFEASKDILASVLSTELLNKMVEQKQRESLAYMCIQMGDALLSALNFHPRDIPKDGTVHDITQLMQQLSKKNSDDD